MRRRVFRPCTPRALLDCQRTSEMPTNPRPSHPLRRLGAGGLCLLASVLLAAASAAFPPIANALVVASFLAALAAFGCLVATGLAVCRNLLLRLSAAFPVGTNRITVASWFVVVFASGLLGLWWAVHSLVSHHAPLASSPSGLVGVEEDPASFWVSVVYHLLYGVLLMGSGLYEAYRRLPWPFRTGGRS